MNRKLSNVLKGAVIKVVEKGIYSDTGNRFCKISINGKKLNHRFNSFVNPTCNSGFTDFQTKKLVVAADDYVKNGTIHIYGIPFTVEERQSQSKTAKNKKYHAILLNGKKIGICLDYKQLCILNNICI